MSEENTAERDGSRSFQERVFARFDSVDNRVEGMDTRIEKLEMKQYETRPIWEQALAVILEIKTDVAELKTDVTEIKTDVGELKTDVGELKTDVAELKTDVATNTSDLTRNSEGLASLQSEVIQLRKEVQAGFISAKHEMEHEIRKIGRQLDALNVNWLELKGDQRYLDRRLGVLEDLTNPT